MQSHKLRKFQTIINENEGYPYSLSEPRVCREIQSFILGIKIKNVACRSSLLDPRASRTSKTFILRLK